jgi:hypothetical protein
MTSVGCGLGLPLRCGTWKLSHRGHAAFLAKSALDRILGEIDMQTKDMLLASLAVCAVATSLYFGFGERSPKINLSTYEALGAVTAEETAKLLGNKGRVLVMAHDTGSDKNPSVEAELEAFQRTLKKHAGLSQVTERFAATPMLMMATGGGVPQEQLARALEAHGDITALVLFCALPPSADSELVTLRKRGVKTVVVSSFRSEYGRLLKQGAVHLAIAPQPESPPPGAQPPRTLRERFDQDYVIITAADADRWR